MQLLKTNNMILFIIAFFVFILIGYQNNIQESMDQQKFLPSHSSAWENSQYDVKMTEDYCPVKQYHS
jgi:hypothetical protein